ncbi:hypothetical protein PMZ80_004990 [Knufia obscura]|uniref:BTB domain-containing protein n=2 Tax=Knufia TaxID=430999 RepID=A0AAN8ES45_9EURO|nr:hypothetical protein PMZ80_004990 [Knufia obscura]KAK5957653.1 hypothetical protein OHC33_000841 [Knufia fluminis]
MFSRHHRPSDSFSSRYGTSKSTKVKKSFNTESFSAGLQRSQSVRSPRKDHSSPTSPASLTSAIITICVGPEQRLFAGHEDILSRSSYFQSALKTQFFEGTRRLDLPDECPEVLSAVLEYLYKGDYTPKLVHNKKRDTWDIENNGQLADLYGLDELKKLALRKQGLQSGVHISSILASARWAYDHTPDTESGLRSHYLAVIIRNRNNFKKSTTMQYEMEQGGKLFFDLFVTMCGHMNDLQTVRSPYTR